MTKKLPFESFLNVLYTVRNNLRHGQKEYTERSELIIKSAVDILEEYVDDLYKLIYVNEITAQEKVSKEKQDFKNFLTSVSSLIFNPVMALIVFWALVAFYISNYRSGEDDHARYVDCKKDPQICESLEEIQYEQSQYDDYDWARPY